MIERREQLLITILLLLFYGDERITVSVLYGRHGREGRRKPFIHPSSGSLKKHTQNKRLQVTTLRRDTASNVSTEALGCIERGF